MSRLPEKGDVALAVDTLDARVVAISDGGTFVDCGPIRIRKDGLTGEGVDPLLRAYGDLFDPGELLAEGGMSLILKTIVGIAQTSDPRSEMATLFMQAAALGVLMERARWEKRDAS